MGNPRAEQMIPYLIIAIMTLVTLIIGILIGRFL